MLRVISLVLLVTVLTSEVNSARRSRRQVVVKQRGPSSGTSGGYDSPDRSVYARRSFAQPDIVSDVYEVYVGPSHQVGIMRAASVVLRGTEGVQGSVSFSQERPDAPVFLNGTITGLTPGNHGFHIHQNGDLREGCKSTAGHFNPYMVSHGAPASQNRHVGDLGNIVADQTGAAHIMIADPLISLSGLNSIIGRGVVVHEKEDDLGLGGAEGSLTTGNAGGRIACGVIGIN